MQTPGKRSVGLIVGGALLILATGGGGGYVTSVWSADRDFDEHRITKLGVELKEHARPSTKSSETSSPRRTIATRSRGS